MYLGFCWLSLGLKSKFKTPLLERLSCSNWVRYNHAIVAVVYYMPFLPEEERIEFTLKESKH